MSKKTFAIVSGIICAVATCANIIIALFNLSKEALIIAALEQLLLVQLQYWLVL